MQVIYHITPSSLSPCLSGCCFVLLIGTMSLGGGAIALSDVKSEKENDS